MENEVIITVVSALAAALSFVAFALPFLNRTEKKERYRSVIDKRRRALMEASRGNTNKVIKEDNMVSAKDSMIGLYKMQKLAGDMGEKIRDKMLQAGMRSPTSASTS